MSGLMQDKVVVVTGGGSGIGAASAQLLAEHGATIVVGYHHNNKAAEAIVNDLPGTGHIAISIVIDNADSIAKAVSTLSEQFGRVDVLVNSAGNSKPIPLPDLDGLSDDYFDESNAINLRAPFSVIRAFRPLLEKGTDAAIINIGSLGGRTGVASNMAYVAAKAGLHALTLSLGRVLAPKVRTFTVSPAGVDTNFIKGRDPSVMINNSKKTPLAKLTTPPDVAKSVLACAALMTSSTGLEIIVDEGRHLIGWPL